MATDDPEANTVSTALQGARDDREAHVEIVNMGKTFGDIVACEDISIDISKDEFVVFLGPSGCGKTTTLRVSLALKNPMRATSSSMARTSPIPNRRTRTSPSSSRTSRSFPT